MQVPHPPVRYCYVVVMHGTTIIYAPYVPFYRPAELVSSMGALGLQVINILGLWKQMLLQPPCCSFAAISLYNGWTGGQLKRGLKRN